MRKTSPATPESHVVRTPSKPWSLSCVPSPATVWHRSCYTLSKSNNRNITFEGENSARFLGMRERRVVGRGKSAHGKWQVPRRWLPLCYRGGLSRALEEELRYSSSFIPFVRGVGANYKTPSISSLVRMTATVDFFLSRSKCRSDC